MRKIIMVNNYLPLADCNLHEKLDWKARKALVVYPPPLPLVEKDFYVPATLQVQFKLAQPTRVLLQPLDLNMIPLLI